jgi:hypothetical protein
VIVGSGGYGAPPTNHLFHPEPLEHAWREILGSALVSGLKGTMNALYRKDLACTGACGAGPGGPLGRRQLLRYALLIEHDSRGERVRGARQIDPAQAQVVKHVFRAW